LGLDKVIPRELGVPRLRRRGGQVVAQGVRVVAAEEVGHVDEGPAALAELAAAKVQVFIGKRVKWMTCPRCPRDHAVTSKRDKRDKKVILP
jgi:hypothetical protein